MDRRYTVLLLFVPLALQGLAGCDTGEQASQGVPEERAAPAEDSPSNDQQTEAADTSEGTDATGPEEASSAPGADAETGTTEGTGVTASANGKAAAQSLGCTACHAATAPLVGPSYKAVAKRYDGDRAKILERMKSAVKDGASESWNETTGGTAMPPQPQAVDKTHKLGAIAGWIAGMAE